MSARWDYITDITEEHEEAMVSVISDMHNDNEDTSTWQNEARLQFQKMKKEASGNLTSFDWDGYSNKDLARQAKFYFSWGSNITDEMLMEVGSHIFYGGILARSHS